MRIVVDMQAVQNSSKDRGIGRYSRALIDALLQHSEEHEIILLFNGTFIEGLKELLCEYQTRLPKHHLLVLDMLSSVGYLNQENTSLRKMSELLKEYIVSKLEPDLFLICSLFEGSVDDTVSSVKEYYSHIPTGVILYDLIPLIWPEKYISYPPIREWYEEKIKFLQQANYLFSISESSKQEAIHHLSIPSRNITTISSAADRTLFNSSAPINQEYLNKLNIVKPFLMHTSAYEDRKNFNMLIKAFSIVPINLRNKYQLVLVCKLNESQKEMLQQHIISCGLSFTDVILTGHVSDNELVTLYRTCYLFVFPSTHEGFGLPILEAMSCGAASIGSQTTSIPEVIGMNDALFDPHSPQSIASKLKEVLENPSLWQQLKSHALKQAAKFSWDKSAEILLKTLVESKNDKMKVSIDSFDILKKQLYNISKQYKITDESLCAFAQAIANNEQKVHKFLFLATHKSQSYTWRLEGPFDSSYSLALLNRETARALSELGQFVVLHSTEGGGDFIPNPYFLEQNKDILKLYERSHSFSAEEVDILSRNLYPPRVEDMNAKINMLHHYAWEETGFPTEWVEMFNAHLSGMTCLSKHVEKIMIDAGVKVPLYTSGCGVDHWNRINADSSYVLKKKGFTFLHVSSCFPRKGVEALLEAYGKAFRKHDNVSLVIKTFQNPHNTVKEQLFALKKIDNFYPDVIIIESDMNDSTLKALYEQCDALIAPSCAEGFGLPLAEAMLSGLPVITTGWGGQMDFCNHENAWLVDYQFEYAKTHFHLFDSVWAKIDIYSLTQAIKNVYESSLEERQVKVARGQLLLAENFKWQDSTRIMIDSVTRFQSKSMPILNVAWISSWKTKCGIATYSEHLIHYCGQTNIKVFSPYTQEKPQNDESIRCWSISKDNNNFSELKKNLESFKADLLLIQFNYGFFNFRDFVDFVNEQYALDRQIVIIMHSTLDPFGKTPNWQLVELQQALAKCQRVLVHSLADLNRLKEIGFVTNVTLFPHGILPYKPLSISKQLDAIPIIASYGFCLPHKGLIELIEAVHILHQKGLYIKLKMLNASYPVKESSMLSDSLRKLIHTYHLESWIELNNEFLEDEQSLEELSKANLIVFPYQQTGESASGAVRYGLASGVPVAVTPLAIFDDLGQSVFKLSGVSPEHIAQGIEDILESLSKEQSDALHVIEESKRWCKAHEYPLLAKRLENMCLSLHINKA